MKSQTWEQLLSRCYTPYSNWQDFCIAEGKSGMYYPGVRMENISFPLSVDAVQSAIFSCLSEADEPSRLLLPENKYSFIPELSRITSQWCRCYDLEIRITGNPDDLVRDHIFRSIEVNLNPKRLNELTERCITPYSGFPVTALLQTDIGIFSGVNIELPDWQKGLCAERVAMAKARACGAAELSEIHIFAPESNYVSPCGACRQVMCEQMGDAVTVLHHSVTERSRFFVSDLLPYQFIASNLSKTDTSD